MFGVGHLIKLLTRTELPWGNETIAQVHNFLFSADVPIIVYCVSNNIDYA